MRLGAPGAAMLIGAMLSPPAEVSAELILVENGKPRATIVLAEKPTEQAQQAAQALQEYLDKISGAKLEIRSEKEEVSGARILVGRSAAAQALGVKVPAGFTTAIDEDGFVLRTVGRDLVIAGNEDWHYRGTIYGVYDFLQRLGCRWFFPGAYGEVVPKSSTITAGDLNVAERPSFRMRNIWYAGGMPVTQEDVTRFRRWMDCNKMNTLAGLSLPGDGTIVRLAPPEKHFAGHPEIYALDQNGQRRKDMLCLSEPETVRVAVQTITDAFRSDPQAVSFAFAPPDGHPLCYCERCQKGLMGFTGKGYGEPSLSDLWFRFVNTVAAEVKKEFPDRWLFTNGYANRVRPPEGIGKLGDNIGIQLAVIQACLLHPIGDPNCWQRQEYAELLTRWTNSLRAVFIYDYDEGMGMENLPFPMLHNLQHDLPFFQQHGVWGFWTEGVNAWMVTHLNYYVRAKLMWDVKTDVKALVHDYCQKFYGNAADPVERYVWTLEQAVNDTPIHLRVLAQAPLKVILPPPVVRRLDSSLAEAERLAEGPTEQLHVRVLSLTQQHMKAFLAMTRAADEGDFAEAVRWADEMQKLRDEAAKVGPGLLPSSPEALRDRDSTLESYRRVYADLASRAGGARGELVLLLPRKWEFKPDPEGDGTVYQWYLPGKGGRWPEIDTTLYWQAQGYQDRRGVGYAGKAWYRTSFAVPAAAEGKPLTLTFGGIHNQNGLWIWLNGNLIDYRDNRSRLGSIQPIDLDVTGQIRRGEVNQLAVLVQAPPLFRSQLGGLYRRAFLWSPR